jgi:hypothetical protein
MTVTFTLNIAHLGTEAGPFNISGTTGSNVTTELTTNLSLEDLIGGYTISGIDDNTTSFTIQSVGTCTNYIMKLVSTNVPYVPCTDGMDVVFLVDYTGSMGGAIDGVKTSISNIASTIVTESNSNYRLGLVIFDEYISATNSSYNSKTAYTSLPSNQRYINTGIGGKYQWITAVEMMSTNNETSFTTQLNKLNTIDFPLGSGENTPEPSDIGVDLVGLQNFANSFRTGVARLVVLITDATPSGNDDAYGAADISFVNSLIPQLVNQGVRVLLMTTAGTNVLYDLATETNGVISSGFTGTDIITAIENVCVQTAGALAVGFSSAAEACENSNIYVNVLQNGGTFNGGTGLCDSTSFTFSAYDTDRFFSTGTGWMSNGTDTRAGSYDSGTGLFTFTESCLACGTPTPTPTATAPSGYYNVTATKFGSNRSISCNPLNTNNINVYYTAIGWESIAFTDVLYTDSNLTTSVSDGYYYNGSAMTGYEVIRVSNGQVVMISDCAGNMI